MYKVNIGMWVVVILYLGISIVAGNIITKRQAVKNMSGYFNSSGELNPVVMAFSFAATSMSGLGFLGAPGNTYYMGWKMPILLNFIGVCLVGSAFGNLLIGKPMRYLAQKKSSITLVDLLVDLYQDARLSYIGVIVIIVASTVSTSVQWQCIGNLFTLFGIDYKVGVIVGVLVVALYTNIGGNSSQALVGMIQSLIGVLVGIIIVFIGVRAVGGFTAMNTQLADIDWGLVSMTNNGSYPALLGFTFMLGGAAGLGQPYVVVKYFQIKSSKLLPKALFWGMLGLVCMYLVTIIGLSMRVMIETGKLAPINSMDTLVTRFISDVVNVIPAIGPILGGLVIAAALCAIMSTASALVLSVSSGLVNDIMVKWMHKDITDREAVRYSRIATTVVTIVSCLIAVFPVGTIFYIGMMSSTLFFTCFGPSLIGGLRWRRANRHGAFWSMLIGSVCHATFFCLNTSGTYRWPLANRADLNGTMMILSTVVYIVVCLCTPKQDRSFILPPTKAELKIRKAATAAQ
jgi:Na+/proline symporter